MEQEKIPNPGQIYKHFKNKLYQIISVATHSETGEKMVVYQALYGNFETYVRSLHEFVGKVDLNKYPDACQKYRFEPFQITENEDTSGETAPEAEGGVNPVLLEFLEAGTYEEKLAILLHKKKHISDKILSDMAVSIDCALDRGNLEERISEFAYCLQTHARFESNRLR